MSSPVFLVVNLYTWMEPFDRHDIEDAIDEALKQFGVGKVTGGGGYVQEVKEGPQCNIDLDVTDVGRAVPIIRRVLQGLNVDRRTEIVQYEPEEIHYPVYDS
jgi:hypothetical protein